MKLHAFLIGFLLLALAGSPWGAPQADHPQSQPDGVARGGFQAANPEHGLELAWSAAGGGLRGEASWSQQTRLVAWDGSALDLFGYSAALSADGNTALIGAPGDDLSGQEEQGSALIFARSGALWSQQAKLVALDGAAEDYFGISVALSADGNTALVGAYWDDLGANSDQGSAYVFTRSGTCWSQQAKLVASDGAAHDHFGYAVALSEDGSAALVGAFWDDVGVNSYQGSAYIFTRSGESWSQQAKLVASDGTAQDYFGSAAALSADGNTALVGAYLDDIGGNFGQGSAYVFARSGESWSQQAKLVAPDGGVDDCFGSSLALSDDGSTALIGAQSIGAYRDAAYVFAGGGALWCLQAKLVAWDGAAEDWFGGAVALSADGNIALVGAKRDDVGDREDQGSAYLFARSGTSWSHQDHLLAWDGAPYDDFGAAVALSAAGDAALIGAYLDDTEGGNDQGSAYVFDWRSLIYLPAVFR